MDVYEVIVVGAGTAGCLAAKTLASKGLSVCLIERKSEKKIGSKVCGDAIGKHHFENLGLAYPKGEEKEGDISGLKVYSPDKSTVFRIKGAGLTGFMINRYLFGQRLLANATDSGVDLRDLTHVVEPIVEKGYVKGVIARDLKDISKIKIRAEVIVDASGISAVIRNRLSTDIGIDTHIDRRDEIVCYREIRQLKNKIEDPNFCEIYLNLEAAPGGYYWIFPEQNNKVNVGLGVSASGDYPNPRKQLYSSVISNPIFKNSHIIHGGGGIVPTRRPLDSLVGNGIVVVGDAACQVNPIHGGGIGSSMIGGTLAGETIASALETNDISKENLWPINVNFMKEYGAKQAGLDAFRIFLQGLTNENLNYGMKYRLIKEDDILKASLGEEIRLNISEATQRVFKGLGHLKFLRSLYSMATKVKRIRSLYSQYPDSPENFPRWKKDIQNLMM